MTRATQKGRGSPISIRGTTYPSQAAAARALGVSSAAISYAKAHGALDRVGLSVPSPTPSQDVPKVSAVIAPIKLSSVQRRSLHRPLSFVFHPRWCSRDDHALVTAKAAGDGVATIAVSLGRPCVAIEQRWHRLRCVPDINKLLEAYGLSDAPYPTDGGGAQCGKAVSGIRTRDRSNRVDVTRSNGGISHEH